MSIAALALFLAVVAVATYFQSVTGFGMAMIVMGMAGGIGLAPLTTLAAVISLMSMANSLIALPGKLEDVDWPAVRAALLGTFPAVVAGVLLLQYLSGTFSNLLRLLLGLVIVHGGITFARRPTPLAGRSPNRDFLLAGVFSGLGDGLFGIAGPRVIFQLYRQPMPLIAIRNMLLLLFACTSAARTLFVGIQGNLDAQMWLLGALAFPVVALAAFVARTWPPPIPPAAMRRIVFGVLILIGTSLIASALIAALAR